MDNNKIGKFIATLRKEKGLTQQALGEKLFVTDKAVSKWERGLSLPDITILEQLARTLDTDIYSVLQIEKQPNIDIEKTLQEEKNKIKKQMIQKITWITIPIIFIISISLFKLIPFGYDIIPTRYEHNDNKLINLGIPKFSFFMKNFENSYSYKNFRGKNILKSEIKNYLNTLKPLSCNNTTYFYNEQTDTTITDYNVKGLLYNTISFSIRNGNYCNELQIKEYNKKLGTLNTFHTLYSENSNLAIYFLPQLKIEDNQNKWYANLNIYYHDENTNKIIENSSGTFEIKDDILLYYRTKIEKYDDNTKIPNVSTFIIKEQKLILKDNYLQNYEKSIILK